MAEDLSMAEDLKGAGGRSAAEDALWADRDDAGEADATGSEEKPNEGPARRPRRGMTKVPGTADEAGCGRVGHEEESSPEESDGKEAKRPKRGLVLGHARAAVLTRAKKGLTRDGAYWCLFCKHVFWSGAGTEDWERGGPSFCCLCGSKLLPGARDAGMSSGLSYSQLAQMSDAEILGIMRAQMQQVWGQDAVAKFSHPGRALPEVRAEIVARSTSLAVAAGKGRSNSRFCDICGHGGTHIACSRCPASFHTTCIILPADYPVPKEGWFCSCCMHEAIRVGEIEPLPPEPRVTKVKTFSAQGQPRCVRVLGRL